MIIFSLSLSFICHHLFIFLTSLVCSISVIVFCTSPTDIATKTIYHTHYFAANPLLLLYTTQYKNIFTILHINIYRTNRRYTFPQPHLRLVFFFCAIKPTHASTNGCTMVLSIILLRFCMGNRDESVIKVNPTNESIVTENNQTKTFEKN